MSFSSFTFKQRSPPGEDAPAQILDTGSEHSDGGGEESVPKSSATPKAKGGSKGGAQTPSTSTSTSTSSSTGGSSKGPSGASSSRKGGASPAPQPAVMDPSLRAQLSAFFRGKGMRDNRAREYEAEVLRLFEFLPPASRPVKDRQMLKRTIQAHAGQALHDVIGGNGEGNAVAAMRHALKFVGLRVVSPGGTLVEAEDEGPPADTHGCLPLSMVDEFLKWGEEGAGGLGALAKGVAMKTIEESIIVINQVLIQLNKENEVPLSGPRILAMYRQNRQRFEKGARANNSVTYIDTFLVFCGASASELIDASAIVPRASTVVKPKSTHSCLDAKDTEAFCYWASTKAEGRRAVQWGTAHSMVKDVTKLVAHMMTSVGRDPTKESLNKQQLLAFWAEHRPQIEPLVIEKDKISGWNKYLIFAGASDDDLTVRDGTPSTATSTKAAGKAASSSAKARTPAKATSTSTSTPRPASPPKTRPADLMPVVEHALLTSAEEPPQKKRKAAEEVIEPMDVEEPKTRSKISAQASKLGEEAERELAARTGAGLAAARAAVEVEVEVDVEVKEKAEGKKPGGRAGVLADYAAWARGPRGGKGALPPSSVKRHVVFLEGVLDAVVEGMQGAEDALNAWRSDRDRVEALVEKNPGAWASFLLFAGADDSELIEREEAVVEEGKGKKKHKADPKPTPQPSKRARTAEPPAEAATSSQPPAAAPVPPAAAASTSTSTSTSTSAPGPSTAPTASTSTPTSAAAQPPPLEQFAAIGQMWVSMMAMSPLAAFLMPQMPGASSSSAAAAPLPFPGMPGASTSGPAVVTALQQAALRFQESLREQMAQAASDADPAAAVGEARRDGQEQ